MTVAILMAAYNGEAYIGEQIESIQNQTFQDWQLFIRDDGSSDKTKIIIREFTARDSRIILIEDEKGNLGPLGNFDELLKIGIDSDIILLADQDDIWFPNKIMDSIDRLNKINNPIKLVYSNFNVWTPEKNSKVEKYGTEKIEYKNLVWQNWIYGCTMCFTKELGLLSLNIPETAVNHDNWIANLANLYGEIDYLEQPTMDHRIHEDNVTTSSKNLWGQYYNYMKQTLFTRKRYVEDKLLFINQLLEIEENSNYYPLDIFIAKEILEKGGVCSIIKMKKNNFRAFTRLQTILLYLCII